MVRMNKINHLKSLLVATFGGILAVAISIVGGLFIWAWFHHFITGQVRNYGVDASIYLPSSILASLFSFYLLARLLSKYSGSWFVLYLSLPLGVSFHTLFFGHDPEHPLIHNLIILLSMVIGAVIGSWHNHHLTSKGIGRGKAAPML